MAGWVSSEISYHEGTKDDGRKTQDSRPKGGEKAQKRQKEGNRGLRGFRRFRPRRRKGTKKSDTDSH